ncbi:MAG TPA: ATP-binding cassette domain-containing protein [Conexibacter sp.]|jgi:ABC-type lipoprotein export system ATPase subunit|nr:ATP-binding cassette domain-containing protein [Conexibacter sp.]
MTAPLLSIEHVSKTYSRGPHELRVLRDVSLAVHPGEFIAVYGQRNAGKTTLLKVAAGVEPPDSGSVRFEGADLATLSRSRMARLHREQIGWVRRAGPQSQDLRMLDYVALPLLGLKGRLAAQQRAKTALEKVGAADCAFEPWSNLSDAERMAVAIAQGLARDPRLLLVDDPAAGLDVLERERIVALLRAVADQANVGVVMTAPDLPAMLRAHDVRSLSNGKLLAPAHPPGGRGVVIGFPGGERSA